MRTLATLIIVIHLLVTGVLPKQQQNPSSIFCDYHNANAFKSGKEYPNGKCYDVYTHPVWNNGRRSVHKLTMRCQ